MEANYAAWFEGGLPAEFEIEDKKTIGTELIYLIKRMDKPIRRQII